MRDAERPLDKSWLERYPRFHFHFTPTSSSWLNLVAGWFREFTQQRLRRGPFHNVKALMTAIQDNIQNHHQNPHIFVWSAPVERIMTMIAQCQEAPDAVH